MYSTLIQSNKQNNSKMTAIPHSKPFDTETLTDIESAWETLFACGDFVHFEEFADVPKRFHWKMPLEYQVRDQVDQLLPCISELMDLLEIPVASRAFRQTYDRNYRRKFPNDNERFLNRDVLDAGIRNVGQTVVNGQAYDVGEINNKSFDAGFRLSNTFQALSKAFGKCENVVPNLRLTKVRAYWSTLFSAFDSAYAHYEHMQTLVLMRIESMIRQPLYVARARCEQLANKFCVEETGRLLNDLSLINRTINAGPGFIVSLELWDRANKIIAESTGPVRDLALAAIDSYAALSAFFLRTDIETVDTCLMRNVELTKLASAYEKSFSTFEKFSSDEFLAGLAAVLESLNEIKTIFPEFAVAVGSYDSEAMLRLPCVILARAYASPELIPLLSRFLPEEDLNKIKEHVQSSREECPACSLEMSAALLHLECPQLVAKAETRVNEKVLAAAGLLRPFNMTIQRHDANLYNEFLMVLLGSFDDGTEEEDVLQSSAGCSVVGQSDNVEMVSDKAIGS